MARFLNRSFQGIAKVFRFEGAMDPPPRVELELGTQLVADVYRTAERHATGAGYSGGWHLWEQLDGTGAGTVQKADSFEDILGAFFPGKHTDDFTVWVMGVSLTTTNAGNAGVACGIYAAANTEFPSNGLTQATGIMVYQFETATGEPTPISAAGARSTLIMDPTAVTALPPGRLPFPLAPGMGIASRIAFVGATTVQVIWLLWIGVRGATPPGMA